VPAVSSSKSLTPSPLKLNDGGTFGIPFKSLTRKVT
jgi:hypothetical protein